MKNSIMEEKMSNYRAKEVARKENTKHIVPQKKRHMLELPKHASNSSLQHCFPCAAYPNVGSILVRIVRKRCHSGALAQ